MTVWFTSDLHLSHKAMAFYRYAGRWPSPEDRAEIKTFMVESHNDLLAERWDAAVRPDDVVWVLGDLTANDSHLDAALAWVRDRPGSKHFILGNHDPAHPMYSDSHKWMPRYLEAFESVQMAASRKVTLSDGTKTRVLLSHFPYAGDGDLKEDRATQFRLRNEGMPLLHGHVHSREHLTLAPVNDSSRAALAAQIHVGVDAWGLAPAPLERIVELLSSSHENLI